LELTFGGSIFIFRQCLFRYGESKRRKIEENEEKSKERKIEYSLLSKERTLTFETKMKLANEAPFNPNEEFH
jgi:hypothetical protein